MDRITTDNVNRRNQFVDKLNFEKETEHKIIMHAFTVLDCKKYFGNYLKNYSSSHFIYILEL